jgi:secondary thiamine-phosphate synthase enzyme
MMELKIKSKRKNEMIDITNDVQDILNKNEIINGYIILFVPHTTAGITINEGADSSVKKDIITALGNIIPENRNYFHLEGNSDAHIKSSIIGNSEIILIENKKLVLGTWQHIFFYEGDGPRNRSIYMVINNH